MSERITAANLDEVIKRNEVIEEQMKQSASLIWSKYNPMQINSPIQLALQILRPYGLIQLPIDNHYLSGAIFVRDGKRIPLINTALPRANQYFTAWHEIYHLLFDEVSFDHLIESEILMEERKAEYFAALMLLGNLMPYFEGLKDMDNSSLAFMHELSQRSYPSDGILSVYDLILIPKWVMEEIEDSTYRSTYVEQLQAQGYPIRWIDETKYGAFVNDEDVNLYYIVEAAVSRVSELMRFLRRKVKTEDLIDLPSAEEWMNRLYDEWPIHGRTLSTGRTLKKNAGEISLTILAEIFAWYHDGVDSLTIYTQDTDAHEFQTNAERILIGNSEFTPALDSPISVAFKSNDFILCQMYREGTLTLDAVRQLRHDDRKLTYTRQQADKSIICRKEVITKEQFIDLIQDATVQILF